MREASALDGFGANPKIRLPNRGNRLGRVDVRPSALESDFVRVNETALLRDHRRKVPTSSAIVNRTGLCVVRFSG